MIRGSIVALITPMHEDGTVDYQSLEQLVEFHVNAGSHGVVAVGTTGESATLPVDEHVKVVETVVKQAAGRIKVLAGNGANSTSEAIELTKLMANSGIDAFLNVTPYYNKPSQKGLIAHFEAIAECSDIPQILYNVPGRCAVDLLPEAVAHLSKHPKIIGIKEATGSIERLKEIKALVPNDFSLLSGDDETSFAFLQNGGHGVISVTANVAPAEIASICNLCAEGQYAQAKEIDDNLQVLHRDLFVESNPVPVKWAMYRMNKIKHCVFRLPLLPPEPNSQKVIEQALRQSGFIND
ncbi:dihydrodipicolinate synthase [Catenovulum agarivorans DS-2]|uniref:4-hydroxy-tetrahydrodipicolinate synthase n=1 Tax=Catenovulum agarivorans DS-2 TaxID=1328313 RepID=W7QGR5_9ALTE|nr:4-hydroxy-tetrahydrodipicolinate synthase [Catenovulum agarivorans]EWH11066.1 dihydrodipicolinate synthase [Catenovulum agarivorans DS-2]